MPERPGPLNFDTWANDINRRLRDVERKNPGLPEGEGPLQTFKDGSPLGDTRFLDFGAGINASLVGDDYVLVEGGDSGGGGPWDALVDIAALVSDSTASPPVFVGIGEALSFLATAGFTRANVFVRPGTYTEAGNWTSPAQVFLFGASGQHNGSTEWDHAAFNGSGWTAVYIERMNVRSGAKATVFAGISHLRGRNVLFFTSNMTGSTPRMGASTLYAEYLQCYWDGPPRLGGFVYGWGCHLRMRDININQYLAESELFFYGANVASGLAGTDAVLVPARTVFHKAYSPNNVFSVSGDSFTLSCPDAGYYDIFNYPTTTSMRLDVAAGAQSLTVRGSYLYLTVGAPATAGLNSHNIQANMGALADITGPAVVELMVSKGSGQVILRGISVAGIISHDSSRTTDTFLDFIAADRCNVHVAGDGQGTSGTAKSFNFDATSDKNILTFAGDSDWAAAGTDAGAGNNITVT